MTTIRRATALDKMIRLRKNIAELGTDKETKTGKKVKAYTVDEAFRIQRIKEELKVLTDQYPYLAYACYM